MAGPPIRSRATEYATTDLGLAAFLIVRGYPLTGLAGAPGGRRLFIFPPDAAGEGPAFYQKAMIPARDYFTAVRDLKALLQQA
jgi:hypothetical protein